MATTEQKTFYDQHPFDWAPADASQDIRSIVSGPLVDLIQSLDTHSLVLDIGCGPGRVLGFLAQRGIRCIGLDRSRVSLGLAIERYGRPGAVGDNLHLPFADETADVVISDGVIHHTENPQAAFAENFRILKPGGKMYLAVYKPSGRYPLLSQFRGAWIRAGLRTIGPDRSSCCSSACRISWCISCVPAANAPGRAPAIFSSIISSRRVSPFSRAIASKVGAPSPEDASSTMKKI